MTKMGWLRALRIQRPGFAILIWLVLAAPASAHGPSGGILDEVAFDQRLGEQIPLDLTFRDETGQTVALGSYFDRKPVILTLNYFNCPNLCPLELDDLVNSLGALSFTIGQEYNVVTVSFDPRDSPSTATTVRDTYLRRYGRSDAVGGWHFLTGEQPAIEQLTKAVGFHYAYDAQQNQYAHPTGIVVLTPTGRIARYLYGLDFPSRDVRLALVEASQSTIGSPVDQVLLACYHYDPATGRYSPMVLTGVRIGGIATILLLGAFLGMMWRRELRRDDHGRGSVE